MTKGRKKTSSRLLVEQRLKGEGHRLLPPAEPSSRSWSDLRPMTWRPRSAVRSIGLDDLRKLCGLVLGAVPVNHGAHLLRRRLAYELQARALGDLASRDPA